MKIILSIIILLFVSCSGDKSSIVELCKKMNCSINGVTETTSLIPQDNNDNNEELVNEKAKEYLHELLSTDKFRDSYGVLLPKKEDGSFKDEGDALLWNSVALASFCMIDYANKKGNLSGKSFNLKEDISLLWWNYKNFQQSDGRLVRHPFLADGATRTSISKDQITGFLYLGAIAKLYECDPIVSEYGEMIYNFAEYGRNHNWEMGVGITESSTTMWRNRHVLEMVLKMYNQKSNTLSLETSIHTPKINSQLADWLNENKYWCNRGSLGSCLKIGDAGVFGNHLTMLVLSISKIDILVNSNPTHTDSEVNSWLANLAKVGDSINANNWLFVANYRRYVDRMPSYNDVDKFLLNNFPKHLPDETNGVEGWGCTDYIWQRVPIEHCSEDGTQHLGLDFLHVFAISRSK